MAEASTRRVLAFAGLWALVVGATAAVSGCYGHNCDDNDVKTFGGNEGEGRLLSADLWETGPIDGQWLPFPRRRAWILDVTKLGNDRVAQLIVPYVSAQSNPLAESGNFTIGGGNLAEISSVVNGQVVVKNGTCADYFVRVVVLAAPRAPGADDAASDTPDASVAPDSSAPLLDAGSDAGADAAQ